VAGAVESPVLTSLALSASPITLHAKGACEHLRAATRRDAKP